MVWSLSPAPFSHDPIERQDLRATATIMGASAQASGGTVAWVADHTPHLKQVPIGSAMTGSDWMGLPVTTAAVAGETRTTDLVPAWAALLAALIFLAIGWWREGH